MSFMVGTGEAFETDPVSQGLHDAVVAEVLDLGRRHSNFGDGDEITHQGLFILQTDEEQSSGQFRGQPKELWQFFNVKAGIGDRTNLKKFLEGWRGRPFTQDELAAIERDKLDLEEHCVGKALQVVVTHTITKQGKTRAKVEASLPPNRDEMKRIRVRDYTPLRQRELDMNTIFGKPAEEASVPVDLTANESNGMSEPEEDRSPLPF